MRIGIVGAGAIARSHLTTLAEHPEASVAAVCDLNAAVAEETAGLAGGATAYQELEAMLAAEALDGVFVCTPPAAHLAPAAAALERGIPVYLEKPLARAAADGEAIVSAWRASGVPCAVGYQWRSLDVLDRVRAELADAPPGLLVSRGLGAPRPQRPGRTGTWFDGRAGERRRPLRARQATTSTCSGPSPARSTEVQAASAGGLLATAAAGAPDLDDAVAVLMRFAGGGLGMVALGWTDAQQPPVYSLDVMAADVALRLDLAGPGRVHGRSHGADVDSAGVADPRRASVAHFLAAVAGGGQAVIPCSPEDALGTLKVVLAAERAVATGERIAVDGG